MNNLILVLICSVALFGCVDDLKAFDGVEVAPEKVSDMSGLWLNQYCHPDEGLNMHRLTIGIDQYGNVTKGKRHYMLKESQPDAEKRCEGGFYKSVDSTDYITGANDSLWPFDDGTSTEYVKVISFDSGSVEAYEAKHYYHPNGTLYDAFITEKVIAGDCIASDTCNDVDDRFLQSDTGSESVYKRIMGVEGL